MPSKAKKVDRDVARLPSIPKELVELFLTGQMTGEAINDAGIAFKKALIEASLNAELSRADDALVDIASGGFDCGMRLMELMPEDMMAIPVGLEQQHIVVAAPLYLQETPDISSPADLHAHECIQLRLSDAARYRWEFERRGEALSRATEGRLVFDSTRLVLAAARAGFGVGYVTRLLAARDLETGSLVQLLADWTPRYPGLAVYYPRNRYLSAGMRAFIDFVRKSPRRAG